MIPEVSPWKIESLPVVAKVWKEFET